MAAISAAVIQLCAPGDEIVAERTVYGGTHALLENFLPERFGVTARFVDATDAAEVEAAMTDRTRLVFCETVANPTLDIADIPALAAIAHRRGAKLVVDNTFSPLIVSPARLGADIVIHSMTKFIGGCSDIIAGAICGSREFIASLMDPNRGALMLLGPTMTPTTAFDLSLRLPHLGLRVREHGRRALMFAERLRALGVPVWYPGLPDHPGHALLSSMMNEGFGYGGIFGIDAGSRDAAFRLPRRPAEQAPLRVRRRQPGLLRVADVLLRRVDVERAQRRRAARAPGSRRATCASRSGTRGTPRTAGRSSRAPSGTSACCAAWARDAPPVC